MDRSSADQVADFDIILESCAGAISRLEEILEKFQQQSEVGMAQPSEVDAAIISAQREILRYLDLIRLKLPFDPNPNARDKSRG